MKAAIKTKDRELLNQQEKMKEREKRETSIYKNHIWFLEERLLKYHKIQIFKKENQTTMAVTVKATERKPEKEIRMFSLEKIMKNAIKFCRRLEKERHRLRTKSLMIEHQKRCARKSWKVLKMKKHSTSYETRWENLEHWRASVIQASAERYVWTHQKKLKKKTKKTHQAKILTT